MAYVVATIAVLLVAVAPLLRLLPSLAAICPT
jgi:hypothetical protein